MFTEYFLYHGSCDELGAGAGVEWEGKDGSCPHLTENTPRNAQQDAAGTTGCAGGASSGNLRSDHKRTWYFNKVLKNKQNFSLQNGVNSRQREPFKNFRIMSKINTKG